MQEKEKEQMCYKGGMTVERVTARIGSRRGGQGCDGGKKKSPTH